MISENSPHIQEKKKYVHVALVFCLLNRDVPIGLEPIWAFLTELGSAVTLITLLRSFTSVNSTPFFVEVNFMYEFYKNAIKLNVLS